MYAWLYFFVVVAVSASLIIMALAIVYTLCGRTDRRLGWLAQRHIDMYGVLWIEENLQPVFPFACFAFFV